MPLMDTAMVLKSQSDRQNRLCEQLRRMLCVASRTESQAYACIVMRRACMRGKHSPALAAPSRFFNLARALYNSATNVPASLRSRKKTGSDIALSTRRLQSVYTAEICRQVTKLHAGAQLVDNPGSVQRNPRCIEVLGAKEQDSSATKLELSSYQ